MSIQYSTVGKIHLFILKCHLQRLSAHHALHPDRLGNPMDSLKLFFISFVFAEYRSESKL